MVLPRIKNDLAELLLAAAEKRLSQIEIEIDNRSATTVVAVSGGYPEDYLKGKEIMGCKKLRIAMSFMRGPL